MDTDDFFAEDEPIEEEPAIWRPPVACPKCYGTQTRLVTLHHEMSVYACERCGAEFEIEEGV